MGHTNSTANLALPQFIGTDKPTWLSDVNGAFAAIDAYAGNNDAALAITDAKADTAISDAAGAVTTAGNASTTAGNAAATATAANTVAGNALTVANGINSKVGVLTDLTTTDKSTVVNAINEVNGKDAGDIAYDNTGSGLTATNVQAAIDEVAQGGGGGGVSLTSIWSNSDPSQSFAGQTVSVADTQTYTLYLIICQYSNNNNLQVSACCDGSKAKLLSMGSNYKTARDLTIAQNGGNKDFTFDNASKEPYDGSTSTQDNTLLIPVSIYGIK